MPAALLVVAFLVHEARAEYPLIHLRVLARPNIAVPALLIVDLRFRDRPATAFVLPDYLTRIQGLRALQIGDALELDRAAAIRAGAARRAVAEADRCPAVAGVRLRDDRDRQLDRDRADSRLGQRGFHASRS